MKLMFTGLGLDWVLDRVHLHSFDAGPSRLRRSSSVSKTMEHILILQSVEDDRTCEDSQFFSNCVAQHPTRMSESTSESTGCSSRSRKSENGVLPNSNHKSKIL
jgi:hypothetical protein